MTRLDLQTTHPIVLSWDDAVRVDDRVYRVEFDKYLDVAITAKEITKLNDIINQHYAAEVYEETEEF